MSIKLAGDLRARRRMSFKTPSADYVRKKLSKRGDDSRYFGADPAVRLVFQQWPKNVDEQHVLVKVVVLDRLYSTKVFRIYDVRNHIVSLNIDERLAKGDEGLVNDIADTRFEGTPRWMLSFASKYCAWHRPESFQIFDGIVERMLLAYKR